MTVLTRSFISAAILTLFSHGSFATVALPPVEASFTVSGSANNWLVDFTFTNNFAQSNWSLNLAGIKLGATNIVSSPSGYGPYVADYPQPGFDLNTDYYVTHFGEVPAPKAWDGTHYDNTWYNPSTNTLLSGTSMSGFQAVSHQTEAPTSIPWIVHVYNAEQSYTGNDYMYRIGNPGFQGVALAPVPEPETYAMLLAGLGLIGAIVRRKRSV